MPQAQGPLSYGYHHCCFVLGTDCYCAACKFEMFASTRRPMSRHHLGLTSLMEATSFDYDIVRYPARNVRRGYRGQTTEYSLLGRLIRQFLRMAHPSAAHHRSLKDPNGEPEPVSSLATLPIGLVKLDMGLESEASDDEETPLTPDVREGETKNSGFDAGPRGVLSETNFGLEAEASDDEVTAQKIMDDGRRAADSVPERVEEVLLGPTFGLEAEASDDEGWSTHQVIRQARIMAKPMSICLVDNLDNQLQRMFIGAEAGPLAEAELKSGLTLEPKPGNIRETDSAHCVPRQLPNLDELRAARGAYIPRRTKVKKRTNPQVAAAKTITKSRILPAGNDGKRKRAGKHAVRKGADLSLHEMAKGVGSLVVDRSLVTLVSSLARERRNKSASSGSLLDGSSPSPRDRENPGPVPVPAAVKTLPLGEDGSPPASVEQQIGDSAQDGRHSPGGSSCTSTASQGSCATEAYGNVRALDDGVSATDYDSDIENTPKPFTSAIKLANDSPGTFLAATVFEAEQEVTAGSVADGLVDPDRFSNEWQADVNRFDVHVPCGKPPIRWRAVTKVTKGRKACVEINSATNGQKAEIANWILETGAENVAPGGDHFTCPSDLAWLEAKDGLTFSQFIRFQKTLECEADCSDDAAELIAKIYHFKFLKGLERDYGISSTSALQLLAKGVHCPAAMRTAPVQLLESAGIPGEIAVQMVERWGKRKAE